MMIDINGRFRQLLPETDRWIDRAWMTGLGLLSCVLMLWQVGDVPLQDWYEGTIAQVARHWLQSLEGLEPIDAALSAWVPWQSLSVQPETASRLPPVLYWGVALSYAIGGVNETLRETLSRIPSALLTAGSVPLIYALGRELFLGRIAAVAASVLYLTCLPVVRWGRMAAPPGALLFELLLLMLCLLRSRRDLRWTLGLGLVTGLVCMTEGLLGLFWGALGIAFLAWDTPRLLRCGYLWWGLGLGLMPLGLWYGLTYTSQGGSFLMTQWFMPAPEETYGSVSWDWTIALQLGFPWVLFLPSALLHAWKNRHFSWAKFLLSGSGVYGFVAIMGFRQNWPIGGLALYPLFALLVGVYFSRHWLYHWSPYFASEFDQSNDFLSYDVSLDISHRSDDRPSGIIRPNLDETQCDRVSRREIKLWGWGFAAIAVGLGCGTGWSLGEAWNWTTASLGMMTLTCGVVMFLCFQYRRSEALAVFAWGTYVALVLFVSSDQWLWELKRAYPVQPVAQMIKKRTPDSTLIYTSHLVRRSSLDFYSDRQVIPANMAQLEQHLLKDEQPYLLMDLENAKRLPQANVKFLSQVRVQFQGRSQTWALLTRQGMPK